MTIAQLIDLAKSGKLRNIKVPNETPSILGYINLGLIELYKRFPLRVEEALVTLKDGKTEYKLDHTDPDVSMPADADFMWIAAVYQEVPKGSPKHYSVVPVNEEDNPESVQTVNWNTIQVPVTTTGAYLSIIYVASPRYYTIDELDETVPIPPQMLEPLLEYVAFQAYVAADDSDSGYDRYYGRFETSCGRIEQRGMFNTDDMSMYERNLKGFA